MSRAAAPASAARIVIASILRPTGETGIQTHVNTLIGSEAARAADVELVTAFDVPTLLTVLAFGPGRLAKPFSRSLWVWWYRESHRLTLRRALRKRLSRSTPATVYAQDPISASVALDLRKEGYPLEVVLAVHFNGSQADEWAMMQFIDARGALFEKIRRFEAEVIPSVDRLIFVSKHAHKQVLRKYPAAAAIPSWFVPNFVGGMEDREERPVLGDLLSIGSLEPRKNHAFSLRVLAQAHARGYHYRMAIVGAGPLEQELTELARSLGIDSFVDFLGFVPQAGEMFASYRACLHAATMENMPMALIEALAAGRPIFALPVGGIPEIFTDGVEGRYLNENDVAASADALIDVLESPEVYERMSLAARERFRTNFTAEGVVPRLIRAIRGESEPAFSGRS